MEEMGLAEQSAGDMLAQVVDMLRQGATAEQLLQMGVPMEMIKMAMQEMDRTAAPEVTNGGMQGMATVNTLQGL
jgi:hypothetical protein